MTITLSSARRLATGAIGASAVAGAILFGASPVVNAAPAHAPAFVGPAHVAPVRGGGDGDGGGGGHGHGWGPGVGHGGWGWRGDGDRDWDDWGRGWGWGWGPGGWWR
jgi:hypothetical protein